MHRPYRFILCLWLVLAVYGLSASAASSAASSAARAPASRLYPPLAGPMADMPARFDLGTRAQQRPLPADPAVLLPWSRLAFSTYQDNNWEIYLAHDDGSHGRRLTHHPGADTGAQMDRGCQTIVFSSDRDGDDEIFVMREDGGGLRQLTFNSADDYNPTWSPDGRQMLFQSYRHGQSDVYLMQADGSQTIRLTNDPAYDGMPAWSPDGQQIAFVSTRQDGWRIWVMEATGSNQRQLSHQRFSENPVWSPDGHHIAYDADGDNDGWQELWLMDAAGGGQRSVHDPGYPYDAWASSWSPDGQHIAFTRAQWLNHGGTWYWVGAELFRWRMPYGGSTPLVSGMTAIQPAWQTVDAVAPTTAVATLPPYLRHDAEVHWAGADVGDAGIRHFDVQYRPGANGAWTDWQMNVPPGSNNMAVFSHQPGQRVFFRSRAVDNAFNREAWPAGDGDTATAFYSWAIYGAARDNRGTPLSGVTASGGGPTFEIWPSGPNGAYRSYYAGYDYAFWTAWTKTGYLDLPATTFLASQDAESNVYLPPYDNVIQDWGFEAGALPSADWSTGGVYPPTVTDTVRHTGTHAVFLGLPFDFEPPDSLFNGQVQDFGPEIATDGSEGLHALWSSGDYGAKQLHYAYRAAGEEWAPAQFLTPAVQDIQQVQWGVSDGRRVHVIWRAYHPSNDLLYHVWRDESGLWSSPSVIYGQGRIQPIRLVVDGAGDAHLVWELQQTSIDDYYYAYADANGVWSSPSRIGATGEYTVDDLAVGADGRVHLLWRYSGDDILYSYRQSDGSWSARELVYPGGYNWYHRLVVTAQGHIHVVWSNVSSGRLFHRRRLPDGSWSPVKLLVENEPFGENDMQVVPATDGGLTIAWPGGDANQYCLGLAYAQIDGLGAWTGPFARPTSGHCVRDLWLGLDGDRPVAVVRSDTAVCQASLDAASQGLRRCADPAIANPNLAIALGAQAAVYVAGEDEGEVRFTEMTRAAEAGDATIAQTVVLPAGASHPTLSFVYLLDGATEDGGYLEVTASAGLTRTSLFSTTVPASHWTHHWLDLAAWSGQSVTVTFAVHQVTGAFNTAAYLDEATLGGAYPDTWVRLTAPGGAAPGQTVEMLLDYGNRGGVAAESGWLTLTLPAEISFVSALPPPTTVTPTLGWDLGLLPAGGHGQIAVTALMSGDANLDDRLTAEARVAVAGLELELFNNAYEAVVRVGRLTYVPFIWRP